MFQSGQTVPQSGVRSHYYATNNNNNIDRCVVVAVTLSVYVKNSIGIGLGRERQVCDVGQRHVAAAYAKFRKSIPFVITF